MAKEVSISEAEKALRWVTVRLDLVKMISIHPDAAIKTDVGASLFSGLAELFSVEYDEEDNIIILTFG